MYFERRWYVCSNCGAEADVTTSGLHPPYDWDSKSSDVHWCGLCVSAVREAQRLATQGALAARAQANKVPA